MTSNNWTRHDTAAAMITDDDAIGWENTETGEFVARTSKDDEFIVYHFGKVRGDINSSYMTGVNRETLFRSDTPDVADRVTRHFDTVADHGHLDTAAIIKAEIDSPRCLREWAYLNDADYYTTEKIGNRKQSSGSVAVFDGSTRWGEGAYVALASEHGPRGRDYVSVGYQPNGHYTVSAPWSSSRGKRSDAYELESPTAEFTRDSIIIKNPNGDTLTVTIAE